MFPPRKDIHIDTRKRMERIFTEVACGYIFSRFVITLNIQIPIMAIENRKVRLRVALVPVPTSQGAKNDNGTRRNIPICGWRRNNKNPKKPPISKTARKAHSGEDL
jgi:hypothetical protein